MFWNSLYKQKPPLSITINRKHEMFWNNVLKSNVPIREKINRKHEMFWNILALPYSLKKRLLTVNMKCFEITLKLFDNIFLAY